MATRYTQEMDMEAWERFRASAPDAPERGSRTNPTYLPADVETLTVLLRSAKDAHTIYAPADEDWPRWYAEWILGLRDERGELR